MAQVICEQDPEKPSAAVARNGQSGKLRHRLEGDLDSILLMAMRKDGHRRYATAQAFAGDIQRHLDGLPVLARSDTRYRLRKWVARRKIAAATGIAALALAGFFGWQADLIRAPGHRSPVRNKARPSVAVLGFKNLSGRAESSWISTALTEMLSTELAAGENLRAIPGERVAGVKMVSLADAASYGRDTLTRLRGSLGADYVVVGSYLASGAGDGGLRLDLRVQDAMAGETLITASESGGEADLPALVACAGARVRERLGAGRISSSDAERIRATAPANAEAARLYSEGLQRMRVFDTLAAKDLLQRAAAADPNHALTHSVLALALTSLGDDQAAMREARKAFDLSKDLPRENRVFVEGRYYETTKSWDKAIDSYRALYGVFPDSLDYGLRLADAQTSGGKGQDALKALDELRRMPPPDGDDPRIDLEEAGAAGTISDYNRVLAAAARAEAKGVSHGSRILVAAAKFLKGRALTELDQTSQAAHTLEESKTIYSEMGHRCGMARVLNGLANLKRNQGDLEGSKQLHEQSLAICREIGNLDGIGDALNSIAIILKQQGDFDAAKRTFREALAIRRQIGEKNNLSATLNNLASALLEQGELAEVKDMYTQALAIARESGSKRMVARALNNLGLAMRHECQFAAARTMYDESIAIRRQIGDAEGEAIVLHSMAEVLQDQGDLAAAKKAQLESLATYRRLQNKRGIGYALWALGNFSLAEGDFTAAASYLGQAHAVRNEIAGKVTEAQSKVALSRLNFEEGHLDLAQMFARQAAAEFREEKTDYQEASADAMLALSLAAQKKARDAQKAIVRGTILARKIEIREARLTISATLARAKALIGQKVEAKRELEALLAEATQLGLVAVQFQIRLALGELEAKSGDPTKARAALSQLRSEAAAKGYGLIARRATI